MGRNMEKKTLREEKKLWRIEKKKSQVYHPEAATGMKKKVTTTAAVSFRHSTDSFFPLCKATLLPVIMKKKNVRRCDY